MLQQPELTNTPTRAGFPETDGSAPSALGAGASPWLHPGNAGDEVSLPGWTPSTGARVLPGPLPSWCPWPRVSPSSQRTGVPATPMGLRTQVPGDQLPSTSNLLPRGNNRGRGLGPYLCPRFGVAGVCVSTWAPPRSNQLQAEPADPQLDPTLPGPLRSQVQSIFFSLTEV